MFYRFNAHRARKPVETSDCRLARKIYQKLIFMQRSWANLMSAGAERLGYHWLKALCITVISVSTGYSVYLICDGLISSNRPLANIRTQHIFPFDPYGIKEQLRAKNKLSLYLDSLDNAVIKDSLDQFNQNQK